MDRRDRVYQKEAYRLREAILSGRYPERLPTENALVEQFQVSLTTVKKALSLWVEEGRIVRIAGKGTFPMDRGATSPTRRGRSGLVAFLIPMLPDEFSRRLLKGATERLGGPQGCTHLRELLQQVATVAIQTMFSVRAHKAAREGSLEQIEKKVPSFLLNTCFAYAETGPLVQGTRAPETDRTLSIPQTADGPNSA